MYFLHHHFGPVVIGGTGTAGYFHQRGIPVIACIYGIAFILVSIKFSRHITAATPTFIAHSPEFYTPGFFASILCTQIGHGAFGIRVQVLHPLGHFFYGTASHITRDIRFCFKQRTEFEKFVGTKTIILGYTTPVRVYHIGAIFTRTYSITPVVFITKTTTRPAEVGNIYFFQRFYYIQADAVFLRYLQCITYPESVIDATTQVFGKMSINMTTDHGCRILSIYDGIHG